MLQSVHGVILRTVDYGESSVIFEAYTKDQGMMSFIVSGVRKKKAAISPALIKPGTIFDATAYIKPNKDLHRIKELTNGYTYVAIPFDFIRGSVALFCVEVFYRVISGHDSEQSLYSDLCEALKYLDQSSNAVSYFSIWFVLMMVERQGLLIRDLNLENEHLLYDYTKSHFVDIPPHHGHFLSYKSVKTMMAYCTECASFRCDLDREQRFNTLKELIGYLTYYVPTLSKLRSLDILHSVFSMD